MSDHRITQISQTRKGRFAVFVDGAFAFSMSLEDLVRHDLTEDVTLNDQDLEEYRSISGMDKCRAKAINLLSYREHSHHDLAVKLQRSFDEETALFIADECRENGLVDDVRFGTLLAQELYTLRHYGPLRLREELSKHGLSRGDTQQVLDECAFDFEESALLALQEKYGDWMNGQKEKVRAVNGMYRLGYTAVQTMAAMGSEGDLD